MKCVRIFIFMFVLAGVSIPVSAWADYAVKDSIYFMLDDGEMSHEEMEQEALYVMKTCTNNHIRNLYYNCECVSGAFLQKREKLGPMVPQDKIVYEILTDRETSCTNSPGIAGKYFGLCMETSAFFRDKRNDNEQYCTCVANSVARNYAKNPYFRTKYISQLHIKALGSCNDLNNEERLLADRQVEEKKIRDAKEAALAKEAESALPVLTDAPPEQPGILPLQP